MIRIKGACYFDQIPAGTAQQKRVNHHTGRFFESKTVREARALYREQLEQFAPETPLTNPISMTIVFCYATKDKKKVAQPKTSRPDVDNMVKLVLDVMTECGYWEDDSQVAILKIEKFWNTTASVEFWIEEVVE